MVQQVVRANIRITPPTPQWKNAESWTATLYEYSLNLVLLLLLFAAFNPDELCEREVQKENTLRSC